MSTDSTEWRATPLPVVYCTPCDIRVYLEDGPANVLNRLREAFEAAHANCQPEQGPSGDD